MVGKLLPPLALPNRRVFRRFVEHIDGGRLFHFREIRTHRDDSQLEISPAIDFARRQNTAIFPTVKERGAARLEKAVMAGGDAWLPLLSPQHSTKPFIRVPQVKFAPAVISMNWPTGGVP